MTAATGAVVGLPAIGYRRRLPTTATALSVMVVVIMATAALVPSLLAHTDPNATDFAAVLQTPSRQHLFGTDQLGRDVYARVVHGARVSLVIGIGSTALALVLGAAIGLTAAFGWRSVDIVLMRCSDIGLAFPSILLALLVLAVLGPGPVNALIAIAVGSAPGYARLIRAEAQRVRKSSYVRSAFGFGLRPVRVITTHVLPNAFGPALVLATISSGTNIIIAAGLSFLGFGAAPPDPEWGQILADGRSVLARAWWLSVFPGVAITAVVVAVTVLGGAAERKAAGR